MVLDSAVYCVFPPNTLLGPQEFYVVASKPDAFTTFYGFAPSDNFSGNLSNGGEYVLLTDPYGNPVISFDYNDKFPWPVEPDGLNFCSIQWRKIQLQIQLYIPIGNQVNIIMEHRWLMILVYRLKRILLKM